MLDKHFETPQIAYALISATLFSTYPKETRLKYVKDYYDAISNFDISLPTPVMTGETQRQFSSCVWLKLMTLLFYRATSSSVVKYVSQKAKYGCGG